MRYTIQNPTGDQDIILESSDEGGVPSLRTGLAGNGGDMTVNSFDSAADRDQALANRLKMFKDGGMGITKA